MNRAFFATGLATVMLIAGCKSASDRHRYTVHPQGHQVVADGTPPIAFYFPGSGSLAVYNRTTNSMIYSMELADAANVGAFIRLEGTDLLAVEPDGKVTKLLTGINSGHKYEILYRPLTGAIPTTAPAE